MIFVLKPLSVYNFIRLAERVVDHINPVDIWHCSIHFNSINKGSEIHLSIKIPETSFHPNADTIIIPTLKMIVAGTPLPIRDVSLAAELNAWQAENAGKLIRIEQSTEQPV